VKNQKYYLDEEICYEIEIDDDNNDFDDNDWLAYQLINKEKDTTHYELIKRYYGLDGEQKMTYEELQKLQIEMPEKLVVIGFPANDFKAQEKAGDKDIAAFCQKNYGVTFPLAKKSVVVKKGAQNPVFKWLSDPKSNGWNDQEPVWNFTKYLINEQGELIGVFGPAVSPLEDVIRKKI
jgi:glutathione peroxidase-family protein